LKHRDHTALALLDEQMNLVGWAAVDGF